LQLTGKISLKLDSNSSLILEYGCKSKKDAGKNLTVYCGAKLCNEISDEIKITSFNKLKKLYK